MVLGMVLVLVASGAAFFIGARLTNKSFAPLLALFSLMTAIVHTLFFSDRLFLAQWFPWSGLVFVVQALPLPLILLFLLLLWSRLSGTRKERLRLALPLLCLTLWLTLGGFMGGPPETSTLPHGTDGVVHQTSESSCSAASAATLLTAAQLPATETEMATLCLTRSAGTPMLGVYRGLRHKTEGAKWQVRVLSRANITQLQAATLASPVLISVGLDRWQRGYDPRYITEWGWTPGKRHAVVVFGFLPDGKLDMGDPSVGREKWSVESLKVLWNGEGVQLVQESK